MTLTFKMDPAAYFTNTVGLNPTVATDVLKDALHGMDDGELYLEHRVSEGLVLQDGRIKGVSYDTVQGFGLRSVLGDLVGYAYANDFSDAALRRAGETVKAVKNGTAGIFALAPQGTAKKLYTEDNPIESKEFKDKILLLQDLDRYIRAKDPRVMQVSISLSGAWKVTHIMRPDGYTGSDIRPMNALTISVVVKQGNRIESGYRSISDRMTLEPLFSPDQWERAADEALRVALVNLEGVAAPSGQFPVVLEAGTSAVLLHEAVGHGLEADFCRKKSSIFSDRIGKQVASKTISVVDDGTIANRRGSLSVDDEGTPTERTVLIENGILKNYMQDRMNARLMGMAVTGNGRRESYAAAPMPRMTNTLMLEGTHTTEEMLATVKKGIYVANLGNGQVDITSGEFVFETTEAYLIENGKVTAPIKGATLIGNGPDVMNKITMVGPKLRLDSAGFTCGKNGQSVPVGVGMPSALVTSMTIGGTGK